jgi:hypothetical protein
VFFIYAVGEKLFDLAAVPQGKAAPIGEMQAA